MIMTKSIAIYGASDDLATIEVDGTAWEEQGETANYVFTCDGKSLHVHIEHGRGWSITTRIEDESEEGALPFDVALVQHKYSPKLVVTARDKPVVFIWFTRDDDDEDPTPKTKVFGPS
jgi:hypothetical protein